MLQKVRPTTFTSEKPRLKQEDFAIYYNRDTTLTNVDLHTHDHYEFYFFINGDVEYLIEDATVHLTPGSVLLIAPNVKHKALIDDSVKAYERYVLWLGMDYIEKLSSVQTNLLIPFLTMNFKGSYIQLSLDAQFTVHNLLENILIQSESREFGADLLANAYIMELLITVARYKFYKQPVNSPNKSSQDAMLLDIFSIVDTYIREDISAHTIAEKLHISPASCNKLFKEHIGLTINQYIMKKRLFLAKEEILAGRPILETCFDYNFNDYSTFYRAFCKEFGKSPSKLLKSVGLS